MAVLREKHASRSVDPQTSLMKRRIGYPDRGVTFPAWGGRIDQAFWMVRAQ
jgi:hypothetical protein